jgi:hypothetical protein
VDHVVRQYRERIRNKDLNKNDKTIKFIVNLPGAFSEFRTRYVPRGLDGINKRRSASFRRTFL